MMNIDSTYIQEVINSVKPLPERVQRIGASTVAWWEGKPGDAVIMAQEGSPADRVLAESIVAAQLEGFGYKRASFHFAVDATDILDRERQQVDRGSTLEDEGLNPNQRERIIERQDNWNDLVEKAKRLVNSGNVTLSNSTDDYVVGTVIGDHGTYESTIYRQDPEAPVITGWHCTCKWNQFAWQRTRQWKIYEGRPCSHILALYFVDKQLTKAGKPPTEVPPTQAPPVAPPAGEPSPFATAETPFPGGEAPSVPRGPEGLEQLRPFKPEDVGALDPNEILEQRLGPLAPEKRVFEPEEEESRLELTPEESEYLGRPERIQRPPLEILKERQRQEQQYTRPGESPYGRPSPPGTVSVPGARLPSERNPHQFPGGTYSYNQHVGAAPGWFTYKTGDAITLAESVIGIAEGPSSAEGVGQYQEVAAGSIGEVADQDKTTGFIDVIFPLEGGARTPTHVRCFLTPQEVVPPTTKELKEERRGPDTKHRPFGS
jgi:hypothetical protein